LQDSDLVRQPRYDSLIGIRASPQSGPNPMTTTEKGLPPASCWARQYPIDPIFGDRAPTDHSQDPREGEGCGQDYVWAPPSAGRNPRAPRPHTTPRPEDAQSPLSVAPYPITPVEGLQEGEGRMARTRTQLDTPYPHASTSRQPALRQRCLHPHRPMQLPVAIGLSREDTRLGTRTCNAMASRAGIHLCASSLGWHTASSGPK
jgi:hypothetical protein